MQSDDVGRAALALSSELSAAITGDVRVYMYAYVHVVYVCIYTHTHGASNIYVCVYTHTLCTQVCDFGHSSLALISDLSAAITGDVCIYTYACVYIRMRVYIYMCVYIYTHDACNIHVRICTHTHNTCEWLMSGVRRCSKALPRSSTFV